MRLIDADRLLKDMRFSCSRNCRDCKNSTFLAADEHCGLIDDQPTANEWIPFDPDNPPDTGVYIITGTDGFDEFVDIDVFFKDGIGWEEYGHQVIAYMMPTPEPYKPTDGQRKRWWKARKEREENA